MASLGGTARTERRPTRRRQRARIPLAYSIWHLLGLTLLLSADLAVARLGWAMAAPAISLFVLLCVDFPKEGHRILAAAGILAFCMWLSYAFPNASVQTPDSAADSAPASRY